MEEENADKWRAVICICELILWNPVWEEIASRFHGNLGARVWYGAEEGEERSEGKDATNWAKVPFKDSRLMSIYIFTSLVRIFRFRRARN